MKRKLKINSIYKHFKGHTYKLIYIARDSENIKDLIVYQDVNNLDKVWVRDLDEFNSLVDKEKYPDIKQKYRFEEVE